MIVATKHGKIAEISLQRPPVNALNQSVIDALLAAHSEAIGKGSQAIILSGSPGMFSGGLDVPELLNYDTEGIERFWHSFFALLHQLASSPVPVIAAITGHAPAGGAVLVMHCDYRVAAAGEFKIGLNEVRVGLPIPRNIIYALESIVGLRQASRLTTTGSLLSPAEAFEIGLVDELIDANAVVSRCKKVAEGLVALPPVAMNATRLAAKADFLDRLGPADDARIATDYWFSDETQLNMKQLVAALNDKQNK
jgi:enoyl-CoA hydratase/carnithine racemase